MNRPGGGAVRPLASAAALLLVGGVVGLLVVEPQPGPAARVEAAAAATVARRTAQVAVEVRIGSGDSVTPVDGKGVVDLVNGQAEMTATSTGFPAPLRMLTAGRTVYVHPTWPAHVALARDRPWLAASGPGANPLVGALPSVGDPVEALAFLRRPEYVTGLRSGRVERVRGVATARFTGTLELRRLVADRSSGPPEPLPPEVAARLDVWVAEDGTVRRMRTRITLDDDVAFTATTELFEFGIAVEIAVPPPLHVARVVPAELDFFAAVG